MHADKMRRDTELEPQTPHRPERAGRGQQADRAAQQCHR